MAPVSNLGWNLPPGSTASVLPGSRLRIVRGPLSAVVDFRCRVYFGHAPGAVIEFINGDSRYIGRGWRRRLVADAVAWLVNGVHAEIPTPVKPKRCPVCRDSDCETKSELCGQ